MRNVKRFKEDFSTFSTLFSVNRKTAGFFIDTACRVAQIIAIVVDRRQKTVYKIGILWYNLYYG